MSHNTVSVGPVAPAAYANILSPRILQSWYDHEDDRCISGVVQDKDCGYDIHTFTGARPSIYKEILQELEEMKLSCMWNESEWRDYAFDRRSYSYSTHSSSSSISDGTDLSNDAYSFSEGSDDVEPDAELERQVKDKEQQEDIAQAQAYMQAEQSPSQMQTHGHIHTHAKASPVESDAFMHLYKGYQKYAYYW